MAARPSPEAVTFLLTDIEGSTRLLARAGDDYPALVARHRGIIVEAVEQAAGTAIPTEGDSCLAVFLTPADAVVAAAEAQRRLTAHPWPDPHRVRVRMGVHSGEAVVRDGEYFGLDLHRAARIADAAHGGQVLVSEATQARVGARLPPGCTMVDIGQHRLKDLEAPVGLFQLHGPGLPSAFPPLRALRGTGHNLPVQTSALVGRNDEIAVVARMVADQRLVTVTGSGGVGKTRLALHVGARTIDAFDDGVWLVELAGTRDPGAVPAVIADQLGVATAAGDRSALLIDALRHKAALLILDNFEHVIGAAPLVSEILAACAGVHVLATSRERLLVSGEQVFPLAPLPVRGTDGAADDAIALFVNRARSHNPAFAPSDSEIDEIAAICRLVDGVPLAIELAAAQTRILPVWAVRARLGRGLDALTGGLRDHPPRHRALRATIAWSYELLPDAERRLFTRLAVFRGGRTLDALEAVCAHGLDIDLFTGLTALVDKSMIQRRIGPDGEVSFALLALMHEFASEMLDASDDVEEIRGRHARWFAAFAARADDGLLTPAAEWWETLCNGQIDNLRAALEWAFGGGDVDIGVQIATSLYMFWRWGGPHRDGSHWIDLAAAHPEVLTDAARGRLEAARGYFILDDEPVASRPHWTASLEAFEAAGDQPRTVHSLAMLALSYTGDDDRYTDATRFADRAIATARAHPDNPRLLTDALAVKGELARAAHDDETAGACYREALEIARSVGNERYAAVLMANLASIANRRGDVDTALALARAALTMVAELTRRDLTAWLLGELASHELAAGNDEKAAVLMGAADAALARLGAGRAHVDRLEHARASAALRAALGQDRRDTLAARGAAMSLTDAVGLALNGGDATA